MASRMIARRSDFSIDADDFPTAPWATRSLFHFYPRPIIGLIREPASGRGVMADTINEYNPGRTLRSDVRDYGDPDCSIVDYTSDNHHPSAVDWTLTNPPFKLAEQFFHKAYISSGKGVALFVRINWLQNPGRYERIFKPYPPQIMFFAARVPGAQGKVIKGPAGYHQHCWLVWDKRAKPGPPIWIPPVAQKLLEKDEDYQ